MALVAFALVTTVLFSLIFIPIFLTAWRQEEEGWKRRTRQIAAVLVAADRRYKDAKHG